LVAVPRLAQVTVRSNVTGDTVLIDGIEYGATRLDLDLPPGRYRVEVRKPGHRSWEKEITLEPGEERVIRAHLVEAVPVAAGPSGSAAGALLDIRRAESSPSLVRRGEKVYVIMDYAVSREAVVSESWVIRRDGTVLGRMAPHTSRRAAGGWRATANLQVPDKAPAGAYEIVHRVESGASSDNQVTSFQVRD
jgi:hypothetical protein